MTLFYKEVSYQPFLAAGEDGVVSSAIDRETEASGTPAATETRVIFINKPQPANTKFVNNHISTAKYRYVLNIL